MILNRLQVRLLIQQTLQFTGIINLNLGNPSITLRTFVDGLGLVAQHGITINHFSGDGGQNIRGRFYGFDGTDGLAGCDFEVCGGKLDVDDVTEGFGGVFGDADCCCERSEIRFRGKRYFVFAKGRKVGIEVILQCGSRVNQQVNR